MDIQKMLDNYLPVIIEYGVKLALAVAIFVIGKMIAKYIATAVKNSMVKSGVDGTISNFTANLINGLLLAFVVIAALGQIGIQTASFVAIIGAAGLAVGLALQGSLANFASGVLIILFRPIKLGDFIEAGGVMGTVKNISIFSTILKTGDNKIITVPNSGIMGGAITNYSTEPTRRIDLIVGISYDADIRLAKQILNEIVAADERVLADPEVTIAVSELADSSVNFVVRPWVNSADYWPTRFDLTEKIKLRFDEEGIGIPYPQMDVHLHKEVS
ncbi:mechanosensitive ion channel [Dasania sp. GY-MA-18]|uniref:Small-conductance mechanosensitive channel n=1 Tax=Dasania phycosphaerae TaxID=2950436 RepID=A0A9J6RH16_9GAMM|nr:MULTISPECIES: mechanosensitive ion channel domain-containing protein [Dasania]MCR8921189.1 mechanosensitive ion channel [Dasania sp. GY-MA-18]MCZ0863617.1 mechanosensitive ion channel [Dasania phycosphaerae]MCZ0867345.1 mechanosensitive ion channel [Dasania phycosphaerae]